MSKGSARRPGAIPDGAWEAIFSPQAPCETCYGTGVLTFIETGPEVDTEDEYRCLECKGTGKVSCVA